MSNFDLPPLLGFDPMQKPRFPMSGLRLPEEGVQGPEGLETGLPGPKTDGAEGAEGSEFGGVLAQTFAKMQSLQSDVTQKTRGLVLGEDVELHDVMLAAGKSEVSFNLMLEVRNKLVDAWEKLSRSAV